MRDEGGVIRWASLLPSHFTTCVLRSRSFRLLVELTAACGINHGFGSSKCLSREIMYRIGGTVVMTKSNWIVEELRCAETIAIGNTN